MCSATAIRGCTELTAPGYSRQPIQFNNAVAGVCFSANAYSFGSTVRGAVGRAIYDAPSGGNLLLVMPFAMPTAPARLPWDSGAQGHLRLFLTALQPYLSGRAYTGRLSAGAVIGAASDLHDLVNAADLSQDPANPPPLINLAPLSAGVALSINRGVLQAASMVPAGTA